MKSLIASIFKVSLFNECGWGNTTVDISSPIKWGVFYLANAEVAVTSITSEADFLVGKNIQFKGAWNSPDAYYGVASSS